MQDQAPGALLRLALSRRARGHAEDRGEWQASLASHAQVAGRATAWTAAAPGGVFTLLATLCSEPELAGYATLRLDFSGDTAALLGAGWRWVRISGLVLAPATRAALANGFNGWSESPLLTADAPLPGETNPLQKPFGDDGVYEYLEQPGCGHSWSFTYTEVGADAHGGAGNQLLAALSDDLCHTVFEFDLRRHRLAIAVDIAGATTTLQGAAPLIASWLVPAALLGLDAGREARSDLHALVQAWARRVGERRGRPAPSDADSSGAPGAHAAAPLRGYTSWYYRYRQIDAAWLAENLEAMRAERPAWSVFQVDDGYQERVGDWLDFTPGFPQGLAPLFAQVRAQGLVPGIWCAPFVALEHSTTLKQHPEWLLRDEAGLPVLCGDFPHWGGRFYALDTELRAVREHIAAFLSVMFEDWGAAFLKADFLYAAGKVAAGGLSRAQRGERAHRFLYQLCQLHQVQLLSCGAVLANSYHNCDFLRLGPDVQPSWEDAALLAHHSREKCSTRASTLNALTRLPLDGAMARVDPDVFILRDQDNRLTAEQRATLATVNGLFGSLIFCSDLLSEYSPQARADLSAIEAWRTRLGAQHRVLRVGLGPSDGRQPEVLVTTTTGRFLLTLGDHPSLVQLPAD